MTVSPSFSPTSRYTTEWPWLSRIIRLGTALPPISRLQATTAGCSAGLAVEISRGIRSATGKTPLQCHGVGRRIETPRASVLLGCRRGAHQSSMLHFQPNVTMLQRAHTVRNQERRAALHEALRGRHDRPLGLHVNGTRGFV